MGCSMVQKALCLPWSGGGWAPGGDKGVVLVCGVDIGADGAETLAPSRWRWEMLELGAPGDLAAWEPLPRPLPPGVPLGRGEDSWGTPAQGQDGLWGLEGPTVGLGRWTLS